MLKKVIESNDSIAKEHIKKYVEEKGVDAIRGCVVRDVFDDFISYCEINHFGKIGYHMFRKLLFESYNLHSEQVSTDEGRYYVIK